MPVWHEKTKALQAAGKLQIVAIVQEQHPDRAALFKQWKGFGWPILVDSYNLLGLKVVPSFWGVDEAGTWVSKLSLRKPKTFDAFMAMPAKTGVETLPNKRPVAKPSEINLFQGLEDKRQHAAYNYASLLFLDPNERLTFWSKKVKGYSRAHGHAYRLYHLWTRLEDALEDKSLSDDARARLHFQIGVANRAAWEGPHGRTTSFKLAIEHWQKALNLVPSQYIWRRRIEQYGPRLGKPYPFYDWVKQARSEITERGVTPHPLAFEPAGAEIAKPSEALAKGGDVERVKAPAGKDLPTESGIALYSVAVPNAKTKGQVWRVHLVFEPGSGKWDETLREFKLQLQDQKGVTIGAATKTLDSLEAKGRIRVEFEVSLSKERMSQSTTLKGFTLYHACSDDEGICAMWKQDFSLALDPSKLKR